MPIMKYDVVVVGAGPGGSAAALTLSRAGASVALVDKAQFPRDKACGDLVGPKGVAVLWDLGIVPEGALPLGDMWVAGPTGRRCVLPALPGLHFPGLAWALPRSVLDFELRRLAIEAGAHPLVARVAGLVVGDNDPAQTRWSGIRTDEGELIRADFVIGADGATSTVASSARLCQADRSLWGFALRAYASCDSEVPLISFWESGRWSAFPGYGWAFPGPGGTTNVGLGIGTGHSRKGAAAVTSSLAGFVSHLSAIGSLPQGVALERPLGGWLKMGMVGTVPSSGNVLLVGDAAGLVNPLQGEGISQALQSGVAAAESILSDGPRAGSRYSSWLRSEMLAFHSSGAVLQSKLIANTTLFSMVGRTLSVLGSSRAIAAGWGLYWNDLQSGAARGGPGYGLARAISGALRLATWPTAEARGAREALRQAGTPAPPPEQGITLGE